MKKLSNGLKLGVGIIISVIFMYFAFRKVNFHQMISAFASVDYFFILLVFFSVLLSDWLRAVRWQYFLIPIKRIDVWSLFSSIRIGYAANVLLPARLGDVLRAYVIGRKRNISASSAFATIVTEKFADMFSLLILMALTLVIYPFPDWVKRSGYIMSIVTIVFFGFLILLKKNTEKTLTFVRFILSPFPERFYVKFQRVIFSFLRGFVGLRNWTDYVIMTLLSFLIWVCYGLVFLFGFHAFDFHLPWVAPLVLMVITTVSIVIPSSPGYIGTYHLLCQLSLGLFGISQSTALAFAFVIHGVNVFPFFLLGLAFAWKEGINISKMSESQKATQEGVDSKGLCFESQSVST